MNFKKEIVKDFYLRDTLVENIFINEYMPQAPSNYVKVYLFSLMYADFDDSMTNEAIAKHLSMDDEDVLKAWTYWEKLGVIRKHFIKPGDKFHYQVEFINLKGRVYGKNHSKTRDQDSQVPDRLRGLMDNDDIKEMYSGIEQIIGRLFEGNEPMEILSWITDYNATPEMIKYAYSYCVKKKGHSNYKYVAAVVKEWANQGLKTTDKIEGYLEETDNRHYLYKRILRALGFLRNATEEEKRIMDTWFDQMDFSIDRVLDACKKTTGISNPNINYINTVLKAWSSGKERTSPNKKEGGHGTAIARVMSSYEELRAKHKTEAEERRAKVYKKIPRVREIEEEIRNIGLQISKVMLSGTVDVKSKIKEMKKNVDRLNEEKAFLMTENNFTIDYMDLTYNCSLCKDTGTLDTGDRCSCFSEKLEKIQKPD